ncbi:TIGR04282 family arsenosugar biosynthesis glycosyltransferase [Fodinibius salsisoli]|uniref:TIGR04282 family arsenosugar biosynthesis glycosyltransferase n=1 Tax=Fodinibius salsisoli TaxID=2820877 RepID=A0ABT3PSC9_9BACT|nr:TIGR04282 family arsenosugar biosynthesis glycosyltransferase [Fodinibius salsisoli]MCW9708752.1 TIGR04282 family arsenosugar biosynthesis glycosyltransferase [Fodinibius salsisoli]
MADSTNECLLIFAKNPERGKVKTRLAKTIGDGQALAVYKKLLRITKSVTDTLDLSRQIWYSNYINEQDLWSKGGYEQRLQEGDDLGMRMQKAFARAFSDGFSKVAIIGTDCAAITSKILRQAFQQLEEHPVVIGPSSDGGYYLLGMTNFYPALFEQKEWSTSSVCRETIQQLKTMEISYHELPVLNDIDTAEDLRASGIDIAKSDRECNSL